MSAYNKPPIELGAAGDLDFHPQTNESVCLYGKCDGERILCCVAKEALHDLALRRGRDQNDLIAIAREEFELLSTIWMQKLKSGVRTGDGSVMIDSRDI